MKENQNDKPRCETAPHIAAEAVKQLIGKEGVSSKYYEEHNQSIIKSAIEKATERYKQLLNDALKQIANYESNFSKDELVSRAAHASEQDYSDRPPHEWGTNRKPKPAHASEQESSVKIMWPKPDPHGAAHASKWKEDKNFTQTIIDSRGCYVGQVKDATDRANIIAAHNATLQPAYASDDTKRLDWMDRNDCLDVIEDFINKVTPIREAIDKAMKADAAIEADKK